MTVMSRSYDTWTSLACSDDDGLLLSLLEGNLIQSRGLSERVLPPPESTKSSIST